jgi:hypothetical protein
MAKQVNVVLFRGLAGERYSSGLDALALPLKKLPGVDYVVVAGYESVHVWEPQIAVWKDPTIVISHSFGSNAALQMARNLEGRVKFPLFINFDASQYWSLKTFFTRKEIVPKNVGYLHHFYQRHSLIRGVLHYRADGTERDIVNELIPTTHVEIEDLPALHAKSLAMVKTVITTQ